MLADEPPQHQGSGPAVTAARRRELGRLGEDLAEGHFRRLGFSILGRNVRTRAGEIDLIAFDGRTLVFTEVKTRRTGAWNGRADPCLDPLSGLRHRQRARLRRLAVAWLSDEERTRPSARTIRFDAVGVILDGRGGLVSLDHLEGAW